jgi:hypothetical protein
MPPRRTLLDDDEDFPMAGAPARPAAAAPGPIALDFGAPPETLFQQLVRHWLNERHAPDILPVQAEVLGALLDHIRRQVRRFYFSIPVRDSPLMSLFPFHFGAGCFRRRIRSRRCVGTLTRQRQNTCGSCSYRPKSSASSLPCALISVRDCTRHLLQLISTSRLAINGDLQIEKFARYIVATPEVQEKLSQAELDHVKRCAFLFSLPIVVV